MAIITLSSGRSFEAAEGVSLLEAALQAQVPLPYSCRTGRCSSCKCRVLSGDSVALQPELGLTSQEKEAGWVLGCVRAAQGPMTLQVEDLGGVVLPPARTLPCRIQALLRLAPDVMQVQLRLPPTADFTFLPGQYIDVIAPGGERRSYSLAAAGTADKTLLLQVRAVPGGAMSRYWFEQARPNDLLRLNGPLGTFFLRPLAGLDLVFLATGTGIAPVKAMLEGLAAAATARGPAEAPRSITTYWGGRTPPDLYWDAASLAACGEVPHRFVPVLSRADATWAGARGHVQDVFMADDPRLSRSVVYACGSPAMIETARAQLLRAGLPEHRFHADAFVCSASVPQANKG